MDFLNLLAGLAQNMGPSQPSGFTKHLRTDIAPARPMLPYLPQAHMIPTGAPIPQSYMDSFDPHTRALAQIYQQNPMDKRVMGVDPARFGYQPDGPVQRPSFQPMNSPTRDPQPQSAPLLYRGAPNEGSTLQGAQNYGYVPFQNAAGTNQIQRSRFNGIQ